jgi:acetyl esterase
MPLNRQVVEMLDESRKSSTKPLYELSLEQARADDLASIQASGGPVVPVGETRDLTLPGPAGDLPARLYLPSGTGPFPVLLYLFGGGWTLGTLDTCDGVCRQLCVDASCMVVSVQYRRAPEHRFPAAPEDCYAAARWLAAHAASLGGDPRRLAVGGDSSGGNLAAAVTLMAGERGGPPLRCQVLVYPNTDFRADTPSRREIDDPAMFNRHSVDWYWGHYLADPVDGDNPLASPLRAASLRDLPPALVISAEYDPLRDEAEAYAHRMQAEGVRVELTRYDGMMHGFFTMSGVLDDARRALRQVSEFLHTELAKEAIDGA